MARRQLGTAPSNAADTATKGYVDTGTATLENKTLASPTLTTPVLGTPSSGTLTNCTGLPVSGITASTSSALGVGSIELGHASDTTIARSAAGAVTVEGIPLLTTTSTASLSNKTISGASNTITNLPASATPNVSRYVMATTDGGVATENQANTWAKLATLSTASASSGVSTIYMSVTADYPAQSVTVMAGLAATSGNPIVFVNMVCAAGGDSSPQIVSDSFKIISGGNGTSAELWMRKANSYGAFQVYEISKLMAGGSVTYNNGASWQSATPSGAVNNVSTAGVTAFGVPLAAKVSVPATATSTGVVGQWAADSSYFYVATATNTWRRVAIASW